jgi:hypothetical protein
VPASVGLDKLLHFAATMMLSAGVPLKVVSVFGHAGVAIKGGTCGDVSRAFLGRRWSAQRRTLMKKGGQKGGQT